MALGAPIGGFITQWLSWHWIFLINVPVCIAAVFAALRVIPGDKTVAAVRQKDPPFDHPGASPFLEQGATNVVRKLTSLSLLANNGFATMSTSGNAT